MKNKFDLLLGFALAAIGLLSLPVFAVAQQKTPAEKLSFTKEKVKFPVSAPRLDPGDAYLTRLRTEYNLNEIVAGKKTTTKKFRRSAAGFGRAGSITGRTSRAETTPFRFSKKRRKESVFAVSNIRLC